MQYFIPKKAGKRKYEDTKIKNKPKTQWKQTTLKPKLPTKKLPTKKTKHKKEKKEKQEEEEEENMEQTIINKNLYNRIAIKIIPTTFLRLNKDARFSLPRTVFKCVALLTGIDVQLDTCTLEFDDATAGKQQIQCTLALYKKLNLELSRYYTVHGEKKNGFMMLTCVQLVQDPNELTFHYLDVVRTYLTNFGCSDLNHDEILKERYIASLSTFS